MSSTYAGNSASYPANITLPSDGDPRDASSVNVALEGLADRTAVINARTLGFLRIVSLDTTAPAVSPFDTDGAVLRSTSVDLEAGDIVVFHASGRVECSGGTTAGGVEYGYNDGSLHVIRESAQIQSGDKPIDTSCTFTYTAGAPITVDFVVVVNVVASGGSFTYRSDSLTAIVIRP